MAPQSPSLPQGSEMSGSVDEPIASPAPPPESCFKGCCLSGSLIPPGPTAPAYIKTQVIRSCPSCQLAGNTHRHSQKCCALSYFWTSTCWMRKSAQRATRAPELMAQHSQLLPQRTPRGQTPPKGAERTQCAAVNAPAPEHLQSHQEYFCQPRVSEA